MTNVIDMVKNQLQLNGHHGLYNDNGECGCPLGALSPADCLGEHCEAAYVVRCPKGGILYSSNPDPTTTECDGCPVEFCEAGGRT
jgi:hypothetical protein